MKHTATAGFWSAYRALPVEVRDLADRCYAQLSADPTYPSLHFRSVGRYWSVRVGLHYRALAVREGDLVAWFWIGSHAEYDSLVGR